MKESPEITWSLMHPTPLDPGYMRRVIREAERSGARIAFENTEGEEFLEADRKSTRLNSSHD